MKQRRESASIFAEQGRDDLANDEKKQLEYLKVYLPEQMQEEQVRKLVQKIIMKEGASSPSDIGKCMSLLMKELRGKADGKLIAKLVNQELSK